MRTEGQACGIAWDRRLVIPTLNGRGMHGRHKPLRIPAISDMSLLILVATLLCPLIVITLTMPRLAILHPTIGHPTLLTILPLASLAIHLPAIRLTNRRRRTALSFSRIRDRIHTAPIIARSILGVPVINIRAVLTIIGNNVLTRAGSENLFVFFFQILCFAENVTSFVMYSIRFIFSCQMVTCWR